MKLLYALKKYHIPVLLLLGAALLISGATETGQLPDSAGGLPALEITLADSSLEELNENGKDIRYAETNVTVLDPETGSPYTDFRAELKGRGNSSWKMPKKSYQIKLSSPKSLLGMDASKKWVLISNYADASLMRNRLMYDLAGQLMDYAPDSRHVNLWINGTYLGNYLLCEKVEIGEGRVDLKNKKGLLVEIDNFYFFEEEENFQSQISGAHFVLKDSRADDLEKEVSHAREAFLEFEDYINRFETLLYAEEKDWEQISGMIDVDSFIKYYFLEELAANSDSCRTSLYMYKDGPDDLLHMGPIWDFDKAVGYSMRGKYGGDPTADYVRNIEDYMGTGKDVTWYSELFQIPEFCEEAKNLYQDEIEEVFSSAGELIDSYQSEISSSARMNYETWNISDIPKNCDHDPYEYTDWEDSVYNLKDWVKTRTATLSVQ